MKSFTRLACALAVSLAAAMPCAHAQGIDITALSQKTGPDREARLLEAARKEATVNVYTSLVSKDMGTLAAAFEKRYGVKVNYWRAGSEKVLQRAVTESRAGRQDVDVIETNGPELEALAREKVLAPATTAHEKDLLPESIRADRRWTGLRLNMFVQAYNTNLVKKADLPKSYADLLDAKWKGKLAMEAEDVDWFAAVVTGMGEAQGVKFFRDLVSRNGVGLRKGHTLLAGLVASGEVPFALTLYNHNAEKLRKEGAPIDWFQIQPAYARVNGVGVTARAPHPNAALLFFDYLLGPEGQALLQKAKYIPTNLTLKDPHTSANLRFIDPRLVLDEQAKWDKLFEEIITRQAR
ncbi:MAG TPA: extracellular solute-binding protein [Usitatibacter sp.]|nr:extracellular solute-binding protein [Usitatibacter sp.]